ncbi:MAG: aminoglycoside phosphotransferase [Actinomycetota bacterium]|nr:aminoglycoside phosphotransferase [Actinomycetota bacterium]
MDPRILALGSELEVSLVPDAVGWSISPRFTSGKACVAGDGAAEALLALLRQDGDLADSWQALRLATIPEVSDERAITVDQTNTSVVVGERVIVKWLRSVTDEPQPSLAALAQLSAVGFDRMPVSYAVLTWTSPTGRVLPIAYVSEYLAGAVDGWSWCVDLVRAIAARDRRDPWTADLPSRLGEVAAELHVALATPNHVFPRPMQTAGASRVQRWYDGAFAMLDQALQVEDPAARSVLTPRAAAIAACFDDCLGAEDPLAGTPVQHIHGDLHVGQILRWEGALAIVDFDGNPVAPAGSGVMHPAARDVAQLIRSIDHVGQVVLHRNPGLDAAPVHDWLGHSRDEFLDSYRKTLLHNAMSFLLDERLLAAFELEQELREIVYADRHLPEWAFAPLASLQDMLPADPG